MPDAVSETTPLSTRISLPRPWVSPRLVELPKLSQLTLASVIGGGGGTGGGGSTVFTLFLAAGLTLGVAGCSDRTGMTEPAGPLPQARVQQIDCRADVAAGRLECGPPAFAAGNVTLGDQGEVVGLRSSNVSFNDGTDLFKAAVSVTNVSNQQLNTLDGTTKSPNGINVFFLDAPVGVGGGVTIPNALTGGTFTGVNQSYFQYDTLLAPQVTSDTIYWHFQLAPTTTSFTFSVLVSVDVPRPGAVMRWTTEPGFGNSQWRDVSTFGASGVAIFGQQGEVAVLDTNGWSSRWDPLKPTREGTGTGAVISLVAATAGNRLYAMNTNDQYLRYWDGINWRSIQGGGPATTGKAVLSLSNGNVYALGDGFWRWTGSGWTSLSMPAGVTSFSRAVADAARNNICAFATNAEVWCWNGTVWSGKGYAGMPVGSAHFMVASSPDRILVGNASASPNVRFWNGTTWSTPTLPGSLGTYTVYGTVAVAVDTTYILAYRSSNSTSHIWRWDGTTWISVYSTADPQLFGIGARDRNEVWVVGNSGRILFGHDSTWTDAGLTSLTNQSSVWVGGGNAIFVGSRGGVIRQNDGTGWFKTLDLGLPIASVTTSSIWGSSGSNVWGVVRGTGVHHWDGSTWTLTNPATSAPNIMAVGGSAANDVWAVGEFGTSNHWDGSAWTYVPSSASATGNGLKAVWVASPTFAVAVSDGGDILHWNGTTWSNVANAGNTLNAVWGSSPTDVWAVGAGGLLMHWNGTVWGAAASGTSNTLYGIWGRSATEVYMVGAERTLRMYDGSTWSAPAQSIATTDLVNYNAVGGKGTGPVFIVGDNGVVVRGIR